MKLHSTATLWVARVCTVVLWIVSSALLIDFEAGRSEASTVVLYATPAVTAVVLLLPALAGSAWRAWRWLPAAWLTLAAGIGLAWVLQGNVARQSEARDTRVAAAAQAATDRARVEGLRKVAETSLAEAQAALLRECKTGRGDKCKGIEAAIATHTGTITAYNKELSTMKTVPTPQAGERRVSAALAIFFGKTAREWDEAVELFLPALFGLTVEVAAFATALVSHEPEAPKVRRSWFARARNRIAGWIAAEAPAAVVTVRTTVREPDVQPDEDRPEDRPNDRPDGGTPVVPGPCPPDNRPDGRKEQVLAALLTDLAIGRPFPSQAAAAKRYHVAKSTFSDWCGDWEKQGLIPARQKVGRCKALVAG